MLGTGGWRGHLPSRPAGQDQTDQNSCGRSSPWNQGGFGSTWPLLGENLQIHRAQLILVAKITNVA